MSRHVVIGRALLGVALGLALALGAVVARGQNGADYWVIRGDADAGVPASAIDLARTATKRYAVVIGNGAYQNAPALPNAEADARAMARLLRAHGFRVDERYNLDKRGFEDMMRSALYEADAESEVLFYFAGHGIQIGRRNYLVPVEANLDTAYDAPFETVTLDSVVKILGTRSRLQLVILDSCRDNPFAGKALMTELAPDLYETQTGFNPMFTPVNSLLAYSTSPGAVAFDGAGANSPFTDALVRLASTGPDQDFGDLLGRVRREVYSVTGGRQIPWESSTLVEPFRLRRGEAARDDALMLVALNDGATQVTLEGDTLTAPLERHVPIGAALRAHLDAGDLPVSIATETTGGRLLLGHREYAGQPLGAGALDELVFELIPRQRPAIDPGAAAPLVAPLDLQLSSGRRRALSLLLEPGQCDLEAGDWLDPEGVGLARYPNEIDPARASAACLTAVEATPGNGRLHYQLGRALLAARDRDGAQAAFERARDLGHTRAWHALGDMVADAAVATGGVAWEGAPDAALDLYARGVDEGDPYAYHALGNQLLRYSDTEERQRLGFEMLSQALELGHTFSMNALGFYFLDEDSDHHEPDRGLRYLRESAARNDIYGFNNLGRVYDRGLGGVQADAQQALDWYVKAADAGHPRAPVHIGRMYFKGRLGGNAMTEAIRWYDIGLARGNAWGGANAAWIIANRRPAGFTGADAAIRAAKAAVLRNRKAAAAAGEVLAGLDRRSLDTAAQRLIRDFMPEQEVDGVVGPNSMQRIAALSERYGLQAPSSDPQERLKRLAEIHWHATGIRTDLY